MGDAEGLFFWTGIALIAEHYYGVVGIGVTLIGASLLMMAYQEFRSDSE